MKIKLLLFLAITPIIVISSNLQAQEKQGLILSALGLAGCSKSTTFR